MSISSISSSSSCSHSSVSSSHLNKLLSEKSYRDAYTELSLKLQTESPNTEEELFSICRYYQIILEEGELEPTEVRSLRQDFLKFLKRLLGSHPLAERKLLDEVNVLFKTPGIEWNVAGKIETLLIVYNLCPNQRQEICYILLDLLKKTALLQEKIPMRNLQELELLIGSAKKSLGDAAVCLRSFLNGAISSSPIALEASQMIHQTLREDCPSYFPRQIQESLYDFRERFQSCFEQQFLKTPLSVIQPEEVRQFQKARYKDFHENVLQTIFAFPLQVLGQKRMQTELHVYGSIAREELVPFSDLETIFLLEENERLEPNGRFLRSIIEWIEIQVSALGESPLTLPKEQLSFIDQTPPKGLSLDSTPNLALPPLMAMNDCSPICMTTLSTLCKFQREKQLIEELEKELDIAAHTSDERRTHSREHRLKTILKETSHSEARREITILLENLNTPPFEKLLSELMKRASEPSAPVALAALRQKLEEFVKQNERDLNQALEENRIREQAHQRLLKEIDTDSTQMNLFSLLKTKKIASSSGANFRYEEERSKMLDEVVEVSPSGKTIKRREKKALAKISKLNRAQEPEKILQTTIDIKEDFIVPIFYPFAPLAVYHGIEATNTLDIIDELAKQKRITDSSQILLKEAVAGLYVMRVRLHFRFKQSPWDGSHDQASRLAHLPNSLSDDEQKVLDRAYWMVQRPLHDYLELFKEQGPLEMDLGHIALARFKEELPTITSQALLLNRYRSFVDCYGRYLVACNATLKEHLYFYEFLSSSSFYEPLREIYLEALSTEQSLGYVSEKDKVKSKRSALALARAKTDPKIINILAVIPNRDGYRQSYRMAQQELLHRIEELSLPENQDSSYQETEVMLDIPGIGRRKLKSDLIPSLFNLATGKLNPNPPDAPERPEYKECRHTVRSISKYGLHIKELPDHPAMEYAVENLVHRLFRYGPPATQLVRMTVSENSEKTSYPVLFSETVFGTVFNPEQDWIDPINFTELLISQVLLLPGDANARNFIFSQSILTCIDNDVSFVDPVIRSWGFRKVQLTSILFCLKQPLILHKKAIENFCSIDPLLVLNGWLEDVIQREKSYIALFPEIQERRLLLEQNPEKSFTPFFLVGPGSIARLYEQIIKLQNLFREQPNKEWRPLDLLDQIIGRSDSIELETSNVGPYIRKAYEKASLAPSASERLRKAMDRNVSQSMTSSQALQAQIGKIPRADELDKRQAFSPEQALQELFALGFENITNLGLVVHANEQKSFKSAFQNMLKDGKPDLERQRLVLSCLLRSRSFLNMNSLNLSHSAVLDDLWIKKIIDRFPKLEVLDLRCCSLITARSIELVAKGLKNLRELYISGSSQIKALAGPLIFPDLAVLHAGHCPLSRLNLKAEKLTELKINGSPPLLIQELNTPSLERLYCSDLVNPKSLTQLTRLKKLHLSNCHAMTDEVLAELFSQNHDLQELILDDCSQISNLPGHSSLCTLSLTNMPFTKLKGNYPALVTLHLKNCPRLEEIALPTAPIAQLSTKGCVNLKSLQSNPDTLEELDLKDSDSVEFHEYPFLAYKKLKKLELSSSRISKEEIEKISLELPFLAKLCLIECHLSGAVVFSNPFPRLKTLQIQNKGVTSLSIEGSNLLEIDLSDCFLDDWANSSLKVPSLKVIDLTGRTFKDFKHLACLPKNAEKRISAVLDKETDLKMFISELRQIGNIRIQLTGNEGSFQKVLECIKVLPNQVTQLDLRYNQIGTVGAAELAKALPASQLTQLDLRYNQIGAVGAAELAKALPASHLTQLDLRSNQIGDAGAAELAKALPISRLTQLGLLDNQIGDSGAAELAKVLLASHLTQLDLRYNQIGAVGAAELAKTLPASHLTQLYLRYNQIGAVGATELAKALPASHLTQLDLEDNKIGDAGAIELAKVLPASHLTQLDLSRNQIGDAGATELAKALPASHLTHLDLKSNPMEIPGGLALRQAATKVENWRAFSLEL